jgi:Cu-processing system ATP-binding protein
MIRIEDLHKSFGKQQVLQGIDISIDQPGTISAILGPNGSGKTTLIKSVLGMVIPDRGTIEINDQNVRGKWMYRKHLDYLPQHAKFPENLRVAELISMIKDIRSIGNDERHLVDLFSLESHLGKRINTLSGGTLQKVNLTLALMDDNPLLILDEPTSGLDPVTLIRFKEYLMEQRTKGKIILITTHIMSLVEEVADEIIFLLEGRIHYRGTVSEIKDAYSAASLEHAIANILQGRPSEKTGQMSKSTMP